MATEHKIQTQTVTTPTIFHPKSWSVGFKLALIILVISVPAAFISTYIAVQTSLQQVRESELNKLQQIATTIAGQIHQNQELHAAFARYLSREPRLLPVLKVPENDTLRIEITGRLKTVMATNAEVELLMLMTSKGQVLTSSDPDLVGRNFAFREYFKVAVQGRPFVTSIIVGSVAGNSGVFFSNPIFDQKGDVLGVMVVKMRSDSYSKLILEASNDPTLEPFLIDGDGVVIYHKNPNVLYRSLVPLDDRTQRIIAQDKRFRKDRIESLGLLSLSRALQQTRSKGFVEYIDPKEVPSIAGFAPVKGTDWTVVVSESKAVFSAPLERQFRNFLVIMGGVSAIVLLLTLLLSRVFVSPIRVMARAAGEVEKGNYEAATTNIDSGDEVGQLSRAFDGMLVGIRDREKVRDVFGRMVSPEVREKLLEGSLSLGGENARVSVLFSDIRSFSTLSETMHPTEVVELLNEYLGEMSKAAQNWGGYINNFIGDAIVVVFGVPVMVPDCERRSVFAALEMRERLSSLNKRRVAAGKQPLRNGIGISTGPVVAGQMGSLDRFLYTVIGDTVNVAARLESLTKDFPDYPILINDETYKALDAQAGYEAVDLGEQAVKGRHASVHVWGLRPIDV